MRTINYRRLARGSAYVALREQRDREDRERRKASSRRDVPAATPSPVHHRATLNDPTRVFNGAGGF